MNTLEGTNYQDTYYLFFALLCRKQEHGNKGALLHTLQYFRVYR